MNSTFIITLLLLLLIAATTTTTSTAARDLTSDSTKKSNNHGNDNNNNNNPPVFGSDPGGYMGPGSGFNIPGWGNMGGGYGAGYGGPSGGYSRNGVTRPSVVCNEKGPCYKKKLTCPAKCFTSYSRSGRNYGGGGGGGGCTMDCKKKCVAYC